MIGSIIVAIIALSILIFVHELFHFLIAKSSSIDTPIFSIGFGPKLASFKLRGTDFRISAIPFGGYVELKGMEPEEIKGEEDEFYSKNAAIRAGVVFAGPFGNILFGFLIYLFVLSLSGIDVPSTTMVSKSIEESNLLYGDKILQIDSKEVSNWHDITVNLKGGSKALILRDGAKKKIIVDSLNKDSLSPLYPPIIGKVIRNSPAYKSGLREGARILEIGGKKIENWNNITTMIAPSASETLDIVYLKIEDTIKTTIIPEEQKVLEGDSVVKKGMIGILSPAKRVKIPFSESSSLACKETWGTSTQIFKVFSLLAHRKVSARNLAGPVGIVMLTQKSMEWGIINLLLFVAFISINLAIVNLIPIPPLDGFHIIVSIASSIIRTKPSKKMLQIVQLIGTIIILSLMIFLVFNDVLRIFRGGF